MVSAILEFEGKTYGRIGVRFKGNSSYASSQGSIKRPLKLDFDKFIKGQRFFGMAKLSLNNNAMDPSQIREALGYEIYRTSGVPSARTAFAKVFLTVPGQYEREYAGLYTVVEQIDERFLQEHFRSAQALLVKPEMGLGYQGESWETYREMYDAKTEGTPDQQKKFIAFTKLLNADDETFREQISQVMDTDQFLRFLAVTTAEANIDSALAMGHNFYLVVPPASNKVRWIPWDLNLAFDQKELSISHPAAGNNRFIPRLLDIPEMNRAYREHMRAILKASFAPAKLDGDIAAMAKTIRDAVAQDKHVDFKLFQRLASLEIESGVDVAGEEFDSRLVRGRRGFFGPGTGRTEPLKEWVSGRVESIEAQLSGKSEGRRMPNAFAAGRVSAASHFLGFRMFVAGDANHDGKLTRSEFTRLAGAWFSNWDNDQSGILTQDEIAAGLSAPGRVSLRPGHPPPPRIGLPVGGRMGFEMRRGGPQFMRAADGNGDGRLMPQELQDRFGKWFDEWSATRQGVLTPEEVTEGMRSVLGVPEGVRPLGPKRPLPAAEVKN